MHSTNIIRIKIINKKKAISKLAPDIFIRKFQNSNLHYPVKLSQTFLSLQTIELTSCNMKRNEKNKRVHLQLHNKKYVIFTNRSNEYITRFKKYMS